MVTTTPPPPMSTTAAASSAGVVLPPLGLGMAALGRPGYINLDRSDVFGDERVVERTVDRMQQQANAVMDRLFEVAKKKNSNAVLPWLDCARSYGLSEKFVGEYLRSHQIPTNQVYVSSKWGYTYVADFQVSLPKGEPHEVKDHSTESFLKQVLETDEFLGEYVDLYQIHSATFESGILTDSRAHQALADCRNQRGWMIGLSVSSPRQDEIIREAMKIRVGSGSSGDDNEDSSLGDRRLFDSVQCTYNVLEQRPGPALQEAHDVGMDIIIKEGLANGRALRHAPLLEYSKKLSCEPDQLALACILAQPFRPRVLSGAVLPEQLESNFKALELSEKLKADPALLQEIMAACVVPSEEYWSERSALAWN